MKPLQNGDRAKGTGHRRSHKDDHWPKTYNFKAQVYLKKYTTHSGANCLFAWVGVDSGWDRRKQGSWWFFMLISYLRGAVARLFILPFREPLGHSQTCAYTLSFLGCFPFPFLWMFGKEKNGNERNPS